MGRRHVQPTECRDWAEAGSWGDSCALLRLDGTALLEARRHLGALLLGLGFGSAQEGWREGWRGLLFLSHCCGKGSQASCWTAWSYGSLLPEFLVLCVRGHICVDMEGAGTGMVR